MSADTSSRALLRGRGERPPWALPVVLCLAAGVGFGIPLVGVVRGSSSAAVPYADPILTRPGAEDWLEGWTAARRTIADLQAEAFETLVTVLLGLLVLLLAIALIGAVTSLLARSAARRPAIVMRVVLGASWPRVGRLLVAEGLRVVLPGLLIGSLMGAAAVPLLRRSWPGDAAPWADAAFDRAGVLAVIGVFLAVPMLVSVSPMMVSWRTELARFVSAGARSTGSPGETAARGVLAVVQIAASLLLLLAAGLLLQGFANRPPAAPHSGPDPATTLTLQIRLADGWDPAERARLQHVARERIEALPGVVDTSVATIGSWLGLGPTDRVHALTGIPEMPGWVKPARYHAVSPGFFDTHGVRLLGGREFLPSDTIGAAEVAVVNQAFVNHFTLMGGGVGRTIQLHGMDLARPWYTIVGVVDDVRAEVLGSGSEPVPMLYLSTLQHPPPQLALAVRTTGDPMRLLPLIDEVLRELDPQASHSGAMTLEAYLERFREPLRWFAFLFGPLAGAALLLATLGLRGLLAYQTLRRTREIGIRMAVGAREWDIRMMVARESLRFTALGAVLGLIAGGGLARLIQLLLGGVRPFDPILFGALVVLLGSVALAASHGPARRAATVDPQITLQAE